MADEIKASYGITPKLIEGRGGIFDVKVGDNLIFSKHQVGRFPEHHEVLDQIGKLTK